MEDIKIQFIEVIRNRSKENKESLEDDFKNNRLAKCCETLRTEIDSFIRIIYLGSDPDLIKRNELIKQLFSGEKWKINKKNVTDNDMVKKANKFSGYIEYVYKFGCAFIHLSNFHDYKATNPFNNISEVEKEDIKKYLNQYHSFPLDKELNIESIKNYIPKIFEKVSENMHYYFDNILNQTMIDS